MIAEMATGEGKTLCAALPAIFYGLRGQSVHVATPMPTSPSATANC